jgi:hypothetical protein
VFFTRYEENVIASLTDVHKDISSYESETQYNRRISQYAVCDVYHEINIKISLLGIYGKGKDIPVTNHGGP